MSQQNLISVNLPEADLQAVRDAIEILKEKLVPRLKSLSPQERQELPKMGDKTVAFVQKSLEYCITNEELTPKYLDIDEFNSDFRTVLNLREFYQPLLQVVDALADSQMLSGSDAYQAALMFYGSVRSAAKSNIPGAKTIYDDLSNHFPVRNRKKEVIAQ